MRTGQRPFLKPSRDIGAFAVKEEHYLIMDRIATKESLKIIDIVRRAITEFCERNKNQSVLGQVQK